MTEVWKPVPEFEEFYEISNFGNVRSLDRIVTQKTRSGTNCVHPYKGRPLKLDLTYGQYYTFAANISWSADLRSPYAFRLGVVHFAGQ